MTAAAALVGALLGGAVPAHASPAAPAWTTASTLTPAGQSDPILNNDRIDVAMGAGGDTAVGWLAGMANGNGPGTVTVAYRAGQAGAAWETATLTPTAAAITEPRVAVGSNGDAVIAWEQSDGLYAAYRPAGAGKGWTAPQEVRPSRDYAECGYNNCPESGVSVAMDPAGNAIVGWGEPSRGIGVAPLVAYRAAGVSSTWSAPEELKDPTGNPPQRAGDPLVAFDGAGNAVAVFSIGVVNYCFTCSLYGFVVADRPHDTGAFGTGSFADSQTVDPPTHNGGPNLDLAVASNGSDALSWYYPYGGPSYLAYRPAGQAAFDTPVQGDYGTVSVDPAGDAIAVESGQDYFHPAGTGQTWSSVGTGPFVPKDPYTGQIAPADVAMDSTGQAVVVGYRTDLRTYANGSVAAIRHVDGTWSDATDLTSASDASASQRVATDAHGDGIAAWVEQVDGHDVVRVAGLAGSLALSGLAAPAVAVQDRPAAFAVDVRDVWNAVADSAVKWTFTNTSQPADQTTATGRSVSHTFSSPGVYDVTVTAVDGSGQAATASARVSVTIPQAQLTASGGAAGDGLGSSVAALPDGSVVAVGAPGSAVGSNVGQGAVYIYAETGGVWTQKAEITAPDGTPGDHFGASVAASQGDGVSQIVVGAPGAGSGKGAAYVYTLGSGNQWGQDAELSASDGAAGDHFGSAVAESWDSTVALIGAPDRSPGSATGAGTVYAFQRTCSVACSWSQAEELAPSDGAAGDRLGASVAVSEAQGDTGGGWSYQLLAGAPGKTVNSHAGQGGVYLFGFNQSVPGGQAPSAKQLAELTASDGAAGDQFGAAVAASGSDRVAMVGAPGRTVGANTGEGTAYVFTLDLSNGLVNQADELTGQDGAPGDHFGDAVAVSEDATAAVIGASGKAAGTVAAVGAGYEFRYSGAWHQEAEAIGPSGQSGDGYGRAVTTSAHGTAVDVGAPAETVGANSGQGAAYGLFPVQAPSCATSAGKLVGCPTLGDDMLGPSVAPSQDGTVVVAGAPLHSVGANPYQGAAYVYTSTGAAWSQAEQLTAGDGSAYAGFGSATATSSDGSTILVGSDETAPLLYTDAALDGYQAHFQQPGTAYVFARAGSAWQQSAKLTAADATAYDGFGASLAVSADGTVAVIGASRANKAYVFTLTSGSWHQAAELSSGAASPGDSFGASVAIAPDASAVLIGAPGETVGSNNGQGRAYLFVKSGSTWTQGAELTAGDGVAADGFGAAVSLASGAAEALIGGGASSGGAAYVFAHSGQTWVQASEMKDAGGNEVDGFGRAVAISPDGTSAVVGAMGIKVGSNNLQGAAYVYTRSGSGWSLYKSLVAGDGSADDFFGISVGLAATSHTVVVGAPQGEEFGNLNGRPGAAYVYPAATPTATAPTAPDQSAPTVGDGTVTVHWTAPVSDGGSAVTGFDVYQAHSAGGEDYTAAPACSADATATSCTVSGLTDATTYYFTVVATNAVGASRPSSELSATPVAPPPPPPPPPPAGTPAAAGPPPGTSSASTTEIDSMVIPASGGTSTLKGTASSGQVDVTVPSGALPAGTVVTGYLLDTTKFAPPPGSVLVGGFGVSWQAPDGTAPDASRPITLTITNDPSIKAGDVVYVLDGDGKKTRVGTATADGTVTVTFTADPAFLIARAQSAAPAGAGYRLVASDGGVFTFGAADFYGSLGGRQLPAPVVATASTADRAGYWMAGADGAVYAFGDATSYGSLAGTRLAARIVGMAATPDGRGYWLVASDGGVFNFGDATFYGSTGNVHLNQPIVGMAATSDGKGYWLVASDGGVFNFGDATFYGSTGNVHLNQPIVGMAATSDGKGYWLVASDGGVFNFGDATFYGSTGNV
ncbi:fibronectin type III domain-containing protein, partial [Acidiferrimicrobium sp. IK]|uniref:fibronectin type III domain-containing protein n=1 Tax=Acidiferrimicrobium sp. IK TaxID=2871700 RepID=UPI0021CB14F9